MAKAREYRVEDFAYYCMTHKKFSKPTRLYLRLDRTLGITQLMAELECGCSVWIASAEKEQDLGA
jgi:hypothetical protein